MLEICAPLLADGALLGPNESRAGINILAAKPSILIGAKGFANSTEFLGFRNSVLGLFPRLFLTVLAVSACSLGVSARGLIQADLRTDGMRVLALRKHI